MSQRVLVTGGAGFIGSHLAEALVARGDQVTVLDNLSTGKQENLVTVSSHINLICADVSHPGTVRETMKRHRFDLVFHLAAVASVPETIRRPEASFHANLQGTLNVLLAAREYAVKRVVFASSAAVYGDRVPRQGTPAHESEKPWPLSPYAIEKLTGEHYARVFKELYGLSTVRLRFFNVYGPRQDPTSPYSGVISIFVDRLLRNQPVTIFGDGEQTRDFIYVDDVVRAMLDAAVCDGISYNSVNIATGKPTTLNQLYRELALILGGPPTPQYGPERPGDIRHSFADVGFARNAMSFEAQVFLTDGLIRLVDWEKQRRGQPVF